MRILLLIVVLITVRARWNGQWDTCAQVTDCPASANNCDIVNSYGICTSSIFGSSLSAVGVSKEARSGWQYTLLSKQDSSGRPISSSTNGGDYFYSLSNQQLPEISQKPTFPVYAGDGIIVPVHYTFVVDTSASMVFTYGSESLTTFGTRIANIINNFGLKAQTHSANSPVYVSLYLYDTRIRTIFQFREASGSMVSQTDIDQYDVSTRNYDNLVRLINQAATNVPSLGTDHPLAKSEAVINMFVAITDGYDSAGSSSSAATVGNTAASFASNGNFAYFLALNPSTNYSSSAFNSFVSGSDVYMFNATQLGGTAGGGSEDVLGANLLSDTMARVNRMVVSQFCGAERVTTRTGATTAVTITNKFSSAVTTSLTFNYNGVRGGLCGIVNTNDPLFSQARSTSEVRPACMSASVFSTTTYTVWICQWHNGVYCGGCGSNNLPWVSLTSVGLSTTTYRIKTLLFDDISVGFSSTGNNTIPLGFKLYAKQGSTPSTSGGDYAYYAPQSELMNWGSSCTGCSVTNTWQYQQSCKSEASLTIQRPVPSDEWYVLVTTCVPQDATPDIPPFNVVDNFKPQIQTYSSSPSSFGAATFVSAGAVTLYSSTLIGVVSLLALTMQHSM